MDEEGPLVALEGAEEGASVALGYIVVATLITLH